MSDKNTEDLEVAFAEQLAIAEADENKQTSQFFKLARTSTFFSELRIESEVNAVFRQGYDEFQSFLISVRSDFSNNPLLHQLDSLIDRVQCDYKSAMICYLHGLDQTTFDVMRDVMEISYLLRDFVLTPDHIDKWVRGTDSYRRNHFTSGKLRKRYADHLGVPVGDLKDTTEYNGHSAMLHVSPHEHPFLKRGLLTDRNPVFSGRFALADVFHHARDVAEMIWRLAGTNDVELTNHPKDMTYMPYAHAYSKSQYVDIMKFVGMAEDFEADAASANAG